MADLVRRTFVGGLAFSSAPYAELPEQKLTFLPLYYAYAATRRSRVS
jgi:hypothetical protein